mgnify:CR=1 FL=1
MADDGRPAQQPGPSLDEVESLRERGRPGQVEPGVRDAVWQSIMQWDRVGESWGKDGAMRGRVQSMAGLESFSMAWGYAALPVGAVFSILGIIGNLLDPQRMELETAQ